MDQYIPKPGDKVAVQGDISIFVVASINEEDHTAELEGVGGNKWRCGQYWHTLTLLESEAAVCRLPGTDKRF